MKVNFYIQKKILLKSEMQNQSVILKDEMSLLFGKMDELILIILTIINYYLTILENQK